MIPPFSLFFHNFPSSTFVGDFSKIFPEKMMQRSYKAWPTPPCRILSVVAQPNPASMPHGFVPGSQQASKRVLQG